MADDAPSAGEVAQTESAEQYPTKYPDPVPDILPSRQIHLLAGAPGVGKTALISTITASLRDGGHVLGHPTGKVGPIAIIVGDRPWEDHQRWFEKAGYPDIPHYSLVDDREADLQKLVSFRNELPFPLLRRALKQLNIPTKLNPPPFLIIDPISLFLGIDPVRSYTAVAQHMVKLAQLCLDYPLTILATHHTGKVKADPAERYLRAQDKILGSTALVGFAGTVMALICPEESGTSYYELHMAPHHSRPEKLDFTRDEQGLFQFCAAEPAEGISSPTVSASCQKIIEVLPAGTEGITVFEILQLTSGDVARRSLHRILNQLIDEGKIVRVGRGRYRKVS